MTDQHDVAARSTPRLSVVIFVRNAAQTVERALKSVLGEKDPSIELLVLDGGSNDGTVEIIRRYEDRIAFWRSIPDGGPEYAIKEGIDRAKGEVFCLLPADDWFEPGALTRVVDEFAAAPDLGVLSCGARIVHYDQRGDLIVDTEFVEPSELLFSMYNLVRWPLTGGRFIRRRLYEQVGGYNPEYKMSNDLEFLIRVYLARPRTKVVPFLAYTYMRHPSSRTLGGQRDMVMKMMRGNIEVAAEHLGHPSLRPDEARELRRLHGVCSARLAWMSGAQGDPVVSAKILGNAIRHNWLWPMQVIFWLFAYWSTQRRYS